MIIPETMKAVVLTEPTLARNIRLSHVPVPSPRPGWVLIQIKAFGLNHSEQLLRTSEIQENYIHKPIIPGIECVGEIADPSDSTFKKGQKIAALMGGMGRSFNGSYAQYALLPVSHVFTVETKLSWVKMAAVPETFFTAWGSLFECLNLCKEDTLLIRGGTCALGYAAIRLAKAIGCRVIATTHRKEKMELLSQADQAIWDTGTLADSLSGITKALELVGPKTLKDTLNCVEKGGIVCNTGILGNVYRFHTFDPIKEIPNGVYLTGFFSNYPTQQAITDIFSFLDKHQIIPDIGAVYPFEDISIALFDMEHHRVNGKIVITI